MRSQPPTAEVSPPLQDTPAADLAASESDARPVGVAQSVTYIPELESIRGIAMLLVLVFHVDGFILWSQLPKSGYAVPLHLSLVRGGDDGVSLFFCLSAFLLSMPFLAQGVGGKRVDVRRFAVRRALRILPLYYTACLVGIACTSASLSEVVPKLQFLLFPNGIPVVTKPMKPFNDVWWSLNTEFQFYLLLPLLGVALASRRARRGALACLAVFVVTYALYELRFFRPPGIPADMALALSIFGQAPHFLFGIAAAAIYLHHGQALRQKFASLSWLRNGGGDLALVSIVLALALVHQSRIGVGTMNARIPPYHSVHVVTGFLWSLLILVVLLLPLRLKSLVHNRLLERVGVLSYSIYIVHMPILFGVMTWLRLHKYRDMVGWNMKTTAITIAIACTVYLVSSLTYRFIEQPFLKRKERLGAERARVRLQTERAG